jgi:hypothetical protein
MKLALALVLGLVGAVSAGCGRAHLEAAHGRSYHDQFASQAERPANAKPAAKSVPGLDAQESSIIAASYRQSLAPKQDQEKPQPILMVAPPQAASARVPLAPSVPKE